MHSSRTIPLHVGIIMDGNGRWAKQQGHDRSFGHEHGAQIVEPIVREAAALGIKHLTLFGFSEQNWNRPSPEVSLLMHLTENYLLKEADYFHEEQVQFKVIGNISKLPDSLQRVIAVTEQSTQQYNRFYLNLALSYSGRFDILEAVKQFREHHVSEECTEELFEKYLSLAGQPDPDLLIRTSGEQRISNFLLWQCAYSELYFTDTPWPEFTKEHLRDAVEVFGNRNRRFGRL